ncbi:acyl-CoA dehydrogenase [Pseudomonas sp. NA-150]|uniref:acyl-CoA dehydrogenase n=1 Tax=Pseudomonas sp. NA-150 TaxID=3367525 RepID=UPI0037CC6982
MNSPAAFSTLLQQFAARPSVHVLESALQQLMHELASAGFASLPQPGRGQTLERWRVLARVAGTDLALAKLYEGHTDAQAIMAELEPGTAPATGTWGVWAAEPPYARVSLVAGRGQSVHLRGRKAWCSGALQLDWALLTAWDEQQQPQLVAVELRQPSVRMIDEPWQAVGMCSTASIDVEFEDAVAHCVGLPGAYLDRPGFWQGGGGIAACWYGAAQSIAGFLHTQCSAGRHDEHASAHLGAVDAALCGAAAALRETARWIDDHPHDSAELPVRRLRAQVEAAVGVVLEHVGRALGATPFCRNAHFARLAADLPVFLRQSHAERDLAALGQQVAAHTVEGWSL